MTEESAHCQLQSRRARAHYMYAESKMGRMALIW